MDARLLRVEIRNAGQGLFGPTPNSKRAEVAIGLHIASDGLTELENFFPQLDMQERGVLYRVVAEHGRKHEALGFLRSVICTEDVEAHFHRILNAFVSIGPDALPEIESFLDNLQAKQTSRVGDYDRLVIEGVLDWGVVAVPLIVRIGLRKEWADFRQRTPQGPLEHAISSLPGPFAGAILPYIGDANYRIAERARYMIQIAGIEGARRVCEQLKDCPVKEQKRLISCLYAYQLEEERAYCIAELLRFLETAAWAREQETRAPESVELPEPPPPEPDIIAPASPSLPPATKLGWVRRLRLLMGAEISVSREEKTVPAAEIVTQPEPMDSGKEDSAARAAAEIEALDVLKSLASLPGEQHQEFPYPPPSETRALLVDTGLPLVFRLHAHCVDALEGDERYKAAHLLGKVVVADEGVDSVYLLAQFLSAAEACNRALALDGIADAVYGLRPRAEPPASRVDEQGEVCFFREDHTDRSPAALDLAERKLEACFARASQIAASLHDLDHRVRRTAVRCLAAIGEPGRHAEPDLVELLRSEAGSTQPSEWAMRELFRALERIGARSRAAIDLTLEILRQAQPHQVKSDALSFLGASEQAIEPVREILVHFRDDPEAGHLANTAVRVMQTLDPEGLWQR